MGEDGTEKVSVTMKEIGRNAGERQDKEEGKKGEKKDRER